MIRNPLKLQSYNDGSVSIYDTVAPDLIASSPKQTLRYEDRTVGMNRYFSGLQANVLVSKLLRCPRLDDVSTQDIAIPIDGAQYRIVQVQYPKGVVPSSMDLTLEEVRAKYEFAGA